MELGSLVGETLVKKKTNGKGGGAYRWPKVGNQAAGAWICVHHWKWMWV
jgi:hypothetical protein